MKVIWIVLFIAATASIKDCTNQPNDLKEYGFKGKVKTVTARNYIKVRQATDAKDDQLLSKWVMHFNTDGNIESIEQYLKEEVSDKDWAITNTFNQFENGVKMGYEKYTEKGEPIEQGIQRWQTPQSYLLLITAESGHSIESQSFLRTDLRDSSGIYKYFQADSLIFSQTYVNIFDAKDQIMATTFKNNLTNENYTTLYQDKAFDKKGNIIKVTLVSKESGEFQRYTERDFAYYD